jgi:hypothetical protein
MSGQTNDNGSVPGYDSRSPVERAWSEGDSHIRRIFQQPPKVEPTRKAGGEQGNAETLCPDCGAYWDCEHRECSEIAGLRLVDPNAH